MTGFKLLEKVGNVWAEGLLPKLPMRSMVKHHLYMVLEQAHSDGEGLLHWAEYEYGYREPCDLVGLQFKNTFALYAVPTVGSELRADHVTIDDVQKAAAFFQHGTPERMSEDDVLLAIRGSIKNRHIMYDSLHKWVRDEQGHFVMLVAAWLDEPEPDWTCGVVDTRDGLSIMLSPLG